MKIISIGIMGILLLFVGCGDRHIYNKNCVPSVTYTSTENGRFVTYQLIDQSQWQSFDALQVSKNNEWLLEIAGKQDQTISDFAGKAVVVKEYPPKTTLLLTGEAITLSPYLFSKAFHSEMTYLKGKIYDKIIWVPSFYLSKLDEDGILENVTSNKKIGLVYMKQDLQCIKK